MIQPIFELPYALDWTDTWTGKFRDVKPGRGVAGWAVARFATPEERAAFMRRYPEARLPSWSQF